MNYCLKKNCVHSLDSVKYVKMTCDCKMFSMIFSLFVISHVLDIEIIMNIIPNVDCTNIIPVFHLSFQQTLSIATLLTLDMKHFIMFQILVPLFICFTSLEIKVQRGYKFSDTLPSNQFTII